MSKQEKDELLEYLKNILKCPKNPLERNEEKVLLRQKEIGYYDDTIFQLHFKKKTRSDNDRIIPIENTVLNEFNIQTDSNVEDVKIHYGPNSDELTKNYHANALTIGKAIYFREHAYKPETEEGRKTLAHELTHIQQNKEDILEGHSPLEELEKEAENAEQIAVYDPDPEITIKVKGKLVNIRKSKINQMIDNYVEEITQNIQNEYNNLKTEGEKYNYIKKLETEINSGSKKWLK